MTQHEVRSADFGPAWPEVAGFGEGTPQQAIFEFFPQGKISKMCKCQYTCPACRLSVTSTTPLAWANIWGLLKPFCCL